uniref:Ubiquitin-like protease family profile domain-containing protein n=1 Tax=Brassica oleracea var. oleracea TaxID=109376 RepID=A0A0D3DM36_BRAOL
MSAVAINRKRNEDSLYSNQPSTAQFRRHSPYFQAPKKRRFSFGTMSQDPNKPSSSSVSRISRYPDAKTPLRREIHAPSRANLIYGGSPKAKPNDCCEKGEFFTREYDNAKRTALDAFRFLNKDKELIDLEEEEEAVSQDSAIEVIDCDEEKLVKDDDNNKKKVEVVDCDDDDDDDEENIQTPSDVNKFGVGDTSTMLDSLSLGREETTDASSLEAYRKLMHSAERRNSKLEALGFEILFNEKRLSQLRKSRPKPLEKPLKKVPHEPFIPLTKEEEAEVYCAFSGRNRRKVLVTHESSNIDITGKVLQCLTPSAWLNDEVINVYLELLKERETRDPKNYLKCHFFNTFFYKKLVSDSGYNFKAVRRWTTQRKLGYPLIDCDMASFLFLVQIFVPIHRGVHWTLAVINNRDRKFLYLDSLNGVDSKILNVLSKYVGDEAKEKSGKDIDVSSWEMEFVEGIPQQQNGYVTTLELAMYDCGMFMLKYIDFFSRGLGLCFSQAIDCLGSEALNLRSRGKHWARLKALFPFFRRDMFDEIGTTANPVEFILLLGVDLNYMSMFGSYFL